MQIAIKLLLLLLFRYSSHGLLQSSVNKMILANVVIVFAPTLNLSQTTLNLFLTYPGEIFRDTEIKRYVVPSVDDTKLFTEDELDAMDPAELTWQLIKTEDLLTQLHKELHTLTESEVCCTSPRLCFSADCCLANTWYAMFILVCKIQEILMIFANN